MKFRTLILQEKTGSSIGEFDKFETNVKRYNAYHIVKWQTACIEDNAVKFPIADDCAFIDIIHDLYYVLFINYNGVYSNRLMVIEFHHSIMSIYSFIDKNRNAYICKYRVTLSFSSIVKNFDTMPNIDDLRIGCCPVIRAWHGMML